MDNKYFGMLSRKHAGVRGPCQFSGTGGSYLWFGDVDDDLPHETGPERVTE